MAIRNRSIGYGGIILAAVFLLFIPFSFSQTARKEDPEKNALKQADALLLQVSQIPVQELKKLALHYTVDMVSGFNVRLQMHGTIKMEKAQSGYVSTFALTEPVGQDIWSWLLLNLFGRHTQEYKALIKNIETRLVESFHIQDNRFKTAVLEEFLPEDNDYPNQTAIKVCFDDTDAQIRFWEDKSQENFSKSLPYRGQVGPLTGFFNYIFFEQRCTHMCIINALKLTESQAISEAGSSAKRINYLFESEPINLRFNHTGQHASYEMCLFLENKNFLDIIYGENVYYRLAHGIGKAVKIPYAIRVEGIISRPKKMARIRHLKQKHPDREISQEEVFARVDEILATKDVKAYLEGFDVARVAGPENQERGGWYVRCGIWGERREAGEKAQGERHGA